METKVAVIDAQPCIREGLKAVLSLRGILAVAGEAGSGVAGLDLLSRITADVLVLDIALPDVDGIDFLLNIKNLQPDMRVIVFTVHNDTMSVRSSVGAGASGYILKSSPPSLLVQAFETCMAGGIFLDPKVAGHFASLPHHGPILSDLRGRHETEHVSDISCRERDVLKFTALGLTGKEIAHNLGISIKTVETYRARAKAKLDLHSRADIVRYGSERGWFEA